MRKLEVIKPFYDNETMQLVRSGYVEDNGSNFYKICIKNGFLKEGYSKPVLEELEVVEVEVPIEVKNNDKVIKTDKFKPIKNEEEKKSKKD